MGYEYLSPAQMYARSVNLGCPPKQGVVYYEEKNIADTMSLTDLQNEVKKGRFAILSIQSGMASVQYTQYYYTETGNLKIDDVSGAAVMAEGSPFTKWVVIA